MSRIYIEIENKSRYNTCIQKEESFHKIHTISYFPHTLKKLKDNKDDHDVVNFIKFAFQIIHLIIIYVGNFLNDFINSAYILQQYFMQIYKISFTYILFYFTCLEISMKRKIFCFTIPFF